MSASDFSLRRSFFCFGYTYSSRPTTGRERISRGTSDESSESVDRATSRGTKRAKRSKTIGFSTFLRKRRNDQPEIFLR